VLLLCWLAFFWTALRLLVGWPLIFLPMPTSWPSWSTIIVALNGFVLPTEWLVPSVGLVAWTLWAWTCLFVAVRLLLNALALATRGAAWVRSLQHASNWLMIPAVRRAVDVSIASLLVARVTATPVLASVDVRPAVAVAFVQPVSTGDGRVAVGSRPHDELDNQTLLAGDLADTDSSGEIIHTVRAGETWASISETYFGTDRVAEQLLRANVDRLQTDGSRITRHGLIRNGQTIRIPMTMRPLETADGNQTVTVESGDTLWAIAARDLGDGRRWPEIYDISKGAVAPDGHVLRDPNLIWPGLVIQEPAEVLPHQPADESPTADSDTAVEESPHVDLPPAAKPIDSNASATAAAATQTSVAVTPVASIAAPTNAVDAIVLTPDAPTSQPSPEVTPTGPRVASPRSPTEMSPILGAAAGGAFGLVGLGGAALVLRRRHSRRQRNHSESDDEVRAGFAEIQASGDAGISEADELDAALRIANRLSSALAEVLQDEAAGVLEDLRSSPIALAGVRHGRSSTTLILQGVPMACRGRLISALPEAATRAFSERADVEGMVSRDGDVLVRLSDVRIGLDAATAGHNAIASGAWPYARLLLRLGLLADRQVFAANWDALSHVLVAAPLGQGAEPVLVGLLAGLVAKKSPAALGFLVIGSARSLPDEVLELPHVLDGLVDPHDEHRTLQALKSVRLELEQRMSAKQGDVPDLVVVINELGQLSAEHVEVLGSVMVQGPRYGVRVLAASARRPTELAQHCPILSEFGTRLVLRTVDEEESLALVGSVDATELDSGGHLLARLEGRVPLQAHGYRAAPDRLKVLVGAIRSNPVAADWWQPSDVRTEPALPVPDPADLATPESEDMNSPGGPDERVGGVAAVTHQRTALSDDGPSSTTEVTSTADEELHERIPDIPSEHSREHEQLVLPESMESRTNGADRSHSPAKGTPEHVSGSREIRDGLRADHGRPRLRGRFLGARELVYDDEVVWPIPGKPEESAMEYLVFLAVQDPSGVRSEMLGDSFWEADDDDIRGDRLKKKRYRLRLAIKSLVPELQGDPLARMDKHSPVHRLNPAVIESDVHRFLKLVDRAKRLEREDAIAAYEEALELYRGDLLDRPDVPPYRWLDDGPRVLDLRVKYATLRQQVRRRLADLLACGADEELTRAQELYVLLAEEDPLDHRLWEALARLHGRRGDLLGLEATMRRLRSALVELGEGEDPERVAVPPALAHAFADVRASLLNGEAA
jgi:LysM domain-containing protein